MRTLIATLLLWVATACGAHAAFFQGAIAGTASCSTPTNSVAPAVTPTSGAVGQLFTSTSGTWTGSPTFAYQWYQVDISSPISGATSTTYTAVSGDVGHTLGSQVVATSGACSSSAVASNTTSTITSGGGGGVAFSLPSGSSLHFMAPATGSVPGGWSNGNDSNNGLTQTTAWATPNHAMNCGEVIVAAAAAYSNYHAFGTVSNCPSTTGGIDGAGGVWFATIVCASTLGTCSDTQTTSGPAFQSASNFWAMEGFSVNSSGNNRAYEADGCGGVVHHIAFINDISADNLQATDTNDCGTSGAHGADYFATVGVISQNSSQDAICLAAIDVVGPGVFDTNAGTHYFIYGNFAYASASPSCRSKSDSEDYMADTWDFHNVTTQGIFSNNIGYTADRMCIQTFWQNSTVNAATIKLYNNTCFENNTNTGSDNLDGEINIATTTNTVNLPWTIPVQNNLAYQPLTISGGGGKVAAFATYDITPSLTNGGSGFQNFFRANNTSCAGGFTCNSTFDQMLDGSGSVGTNTFTNPAYTNTTDLLANQQGVPNCSGFANTTECMGWNANTSTLTTPSVISDLVPTASGTTGKGYQQPSTTCGSETTFSGSISGTTLAVSGVGGLIPISIGQLVTGGTVSSGTYITAGSGTSWTVNNSQSATATGATNYPLWLKGVVYLQWNGTSLTENADLVTKPCGL